MKVWEFVKRNIPMCWKKSEEMRTKIYIYSQGNSHNFSFNSIVLTNTFTITMKTHAKLHPYKQHLYLKN